MINFKSMLICAFFALQIQMFSRLWTERPRESLSEHLSSHYRAWVSITILDWRTVFSYNNSILPWKSFLEQLNLLSQSQSESLPHEFNYIPQWWRHCDPELYALMRKSLELLWNAIFVVLVSDCANNCKMSQMLQICVPAAQKQS